MKISEITEAPYTGNIGITEVMQFYKIATPEERIKFDEYIDAGDTKSAWELIQQVTHTKLQGPEFESVLENFKDGRKPGRKGLAKRTGVDCSKSVTDLRKVAKNSSGEKQRMAHWCANMKAGRKNK
jgi:hypothetical protein